MTEEREKFVCSKCDQEPRFYDFIFSKEFALLMVGVKIVAMVALIVIAVLFFREIQVVKFLNYDQCAYCMNKTGATCFIGTTGVAYSNERILPNETEVREIFNKLVVNNTG